MNLSEIARNFKPNKTALVVTKSFSLEDLDFKKSALSFWGKYVYSEKNFFVDKSVIPEGSILFIFINSYIEDGMAKFNGYQGRFATTIRPQNVEYGSWYVSTNEGKFDYKNDWIVQTCILAYNNGFADIKKFSSLPEKDINTIKKNILISRLYNALRSENGLFLDDAYEITDIIEKNNRGIVLKGYGITEGKKMPEQFIRYEDIEKYRLLTCDGVTITGCPFK